MNVFVVDGSKQSMADTVIGASTSGTSCFITSYGFGVRQVQRLIDHFDTVTLVADGSHAQLNSRTYQSVVKLSNTLDSFKFIPSKIHAKFAIVDGETVIFTSANLSANRRIECYVVGEVGEVSGVDDVLTSLSLDDAISAISQPKNIEQQEKNFTAAELAKGMGLSVARIGQLSKDGIINKLPNGRYPLEAFRQYLDYAKQGKGGGYRDELDKERVRQLRRENDLAEKEVAPVHLLKVAIEKLAAQMIPLLDALPLEMKRMNPNLTGHDIHLVKKAIAKCRNLIAELEVELDD